MHGELDPAEVQARLEALRWLWVPLREDEARAAMEPVSTGAGELTPALVAARLEELRALAELTTYLRQARPPTG